MTGKRRVAKAKYIYSEGPEVEAIITRAVRAMADEHKPKNEDPKEPGLYARRWNIPPEGEFGYQVVRVTICDDGRGPEIIVCPAAPKNFDCGTLTQYEIDTSTFQRITE